jgi:heme/copper-type cytochrome/quinol oxidase subunit 3
MNLYFKSKFSHTGLSTHRPVASGERQNLWIVPFLLVECFMFSCLHHNYYLCRSALTIVGIINSNDPTVIAVRYLASSC